MKNSLHPILAVILGIVLGSAANQALVSLGGMLVPPPPGTDISTTEGLAAAMPLFGPEHFLFPFLAHAAGTFVAVFLAYTIGRGVRSFAMYIIAGLFFLGGLSMVLMVPSPLWFTVVDLGLAYFPAAFLAQRLAQR